MPYDGEEEEPQPKDYQAWEERQVVLKLVSGDLQCDDEDKVGQELQGGDFLLVGFLFRHQDPLERGRQGRRLVLHVGVGAPLPKKEAVVIAALRMKKLSSDLITVLRV